MLRTEATRMESKNERGVGKCVTEMSRDRTDREWDERGERGGYEESSST